MTNQNFNSVVYHSLSDENQQKVYHIYAIALALKEANLGSLSSSDFDRLYDSPLFDIRNTALTVAIHCQRHKYADLEGE